MRSRIAQIPAILVIGFFLLILTLQLHEALQVQAFWNTVGAPTVFLTFSLLILVFIRLLLFIKPTLIGQPHGSPNFLIVLPVLFLAIIGQILFMWPLQIGFYRLDGPLPAPPESKQVIMDVCKAIGLYFTILLGMAAKWGWDEIHMLQKSRRRKVNLLQLAKPLLVSPIVFLFMWGLLREQGIGLVYFLVGFQNGFFWQSLLYPKE
jgi:hypothetical protein